MSDFVQRLRTASASLRRKAMPLSDLVPLINQSADRIEELEAAADKQDWIRVEDALPVVPEGFSEVVIDALCLLPEQEYSGARLAKSVLFWRYAEPTPQPPEGGK